MKQTKNLYIFDDGSPYINKVFNIKENQYEILQALNYHTSTVNKVLELKNKTLISCSCDSSIIFYLKDNNEYKKDYQVSQWLMLYNNSD